MQPIETRLICPSLISFQLGWVDIQPRGTIGGESGVRGGDPSVVKSCIKPCLLWLLAAGSGAGRASWQMASPVVSWRPVWETMFVYWFSFMCCSYFHLPEVPRCYGDRLIGNDSFVRVP